MMRTLRALYLTRPLREKILVVALVAVGTIIWLSSLWGRAGLFLSMTKASSAELSDQALWLSHQEQIETQAAQAAGRLDAARTLDSTHLVTTVSALARDVGLSNTLIGEPLNISSGQFAVHTVPFSVSKASWASLKAFYLSLQAYSPYIGIEQFSIVADRSTPGQPNPSLLLSASFKLSSVEISTKQAAR